MKTAFITQQVAVLFILMIVGYIASKKGLLDGLSKGLSDILTNIALPALIISSFNVGYSSDKLQNIMLMILYSLILHAMMIILCRLVFYRFSEDKRAVLSFGAIFPNSGFMGLPLVAQLFGTEVVLFASVFMIPYHTLLWTYGEGLFSRKKLSLDLIKDLATNPAVMAIGTGLVIFILNIQLPNVIDQSLSLFSSMTLPLSMLILGDRISKIKFRDILKDKDMYFGCLVRLILIPLVSIVLLNAINAPIILRNITIIMQSLPTAILLVVLAQKHDREVELASKFAVVSHILCILTIPLISLLM